MHLVAFGWLRAADPSTRASGHMRVALRKPLQPVGPSADAPQAAPQPAPARQAVPTSTPTANRPALPNQALPPDLPVVLADDAPAAEDLAPVPLGAFVEADQLSQSASPLEAIDLALPEAHLLMDSGLLLLRLWIDVTGTVIHTEVESSSFPDAYTDAVVRTFASRRYSPGQRDGHAVNSVMRLEVRYE